MYAHCLLLASLIFSATARVESDLTRIRDVWLADAEWPTSVAAHVSTYQRGASCWWLRVLSGTDVCAKLGLDHHTLTRPW